MELLILFIIIFVIFWLLGILLPYIIPVAIIIYIWYALFGKKRMIQKQEENYFYQQRPNIGNPDAIDVEYTEHKESEGEEV